MDLIEKAREFAKQAHAGQVRKGAAREPYAVHLEEVAGLVAAFGGTDEVVAAAWLHDTVEDCGTAPEDLVERFGVEVAAIVAEVTDDKSLDKAVRKQLQVLNAPGKSAAAALLKICDKLSNVRSVGDSPALDWDVARQLAYLDWAETVVAGLPAGADAVRQQFGRTVVRSRAAVLARPQAQAEAQPVPSGPVG